VVNKFRTHSRISRQWLSTKLAGGGGRPGFGLLETVVGLGLFAILILAGGGIFIQSQALTQVSGDNAEAGLLAKQGLEAARSIQRQGWALLAPGAYGIDNSSGRWELTGTPAQHGKFTQEITIDQAQRDGNGQLVTSGGAIDPDTYLVTARVHWTTRTGKLEEVTQQTYLTNWQKYIISETLAYACASQSTLGANLNQTTPAALVWSDSSIDNNHFFFNLTSPTQIAVKEDGDYLIALTMPVSRTDGNNEQTRVQAEARVNGVKAEGGVARSSYIRNADSQDESSNHLNLLLTDLQVDDTIEVVVTGLTNNIGSAYPVVIDGLACVYLEQINDQQTVFAATATQTTSGSNFNQEEASPLEWSSLRQDSGYTHSDTSDPEEIVFDQSGDYLVYVNVPLSSNQLRTSVAGRVVLNELDNQVTGGSFRQGYIRKQENDDESSIHWAGMVSAAAGDKLMVTLEQDAFIGMVNSGGDPATILVHRLPAENVFHGFGLTLTNSGSNWNPETPGEVEWYSSQFDPNVYDHDTGANREVITVKKKGDYVLTYNDSLWSWTGRPNSRARVMVNGSPVIGAESKTHFVRGSNDHHFSSATMVYALTKLQPGDQVTILVDRAADQDLMSPADPAIITLWKKDQLENPGP